MATPGPPHGIFEYADSRTLFFTKGLLVGGLIALALLLGLWLVLGVRSRRKRKGHIAHNPWDLLQKELSTSMGQTMEIRMGDLKKVLAKALELRTNRPFCAWTTEEIVREIAGNGQFSSDFQAQCGEFLRSVDRVIYANEGVTSAEHDGYEQLVASWLERLKLGQII